MVLGLISVGEYVLAWRHAEQRSSAPRGVLLDVVEYIGRTVVFVIGNFALGQPPIWGYRALAGRFGSVYVLNDATAVTGSFVPALLISRWHARST
jgi:hypothetical protein